MPTCRICGKSSLVNISLHLLQKHKISVQTYKKKYKLSGEDIVEKAFWVKPKGKKSQKTLTQRKPDDIFKAFLHYLNENHQHYAIEFGHIGRMIAMEKGELKEWRNRNSFDFYNLAKFAVFLIEKLETEKDLKI